MSLYIMPLREVIDGLWVYEDPEVVTKKPTRIVTKDLYRKMKSWSLEDAKKVEFIGTLRDDNKERYLKMHGFTNLVPTHDDQRNAKKLALDRIDLWVTKKPGYKTICDLAGVNYREIEEVYNIRELDISIAVSKKTSGVILQIWKNAFNEMAADGTIMQIKKKWNKILDDDPFPEIENKSKPYH